MSYTRPFSKYHVYKEITPDDWTLLLYLSNSTYKETGNVSALLGKGMLENQQLASAYSKNNQMYPHAYIVYDKDNYDERQPIGFVLVSSISYGYEVDAVTHGDNHCFALMEILAETAQFVQSSSDDPLRIVINDDRACQVIAAFVG